MHPRHQRAHVVLVGLCYTDDAMSSENGDRPATKAELDSAVERLAVEIIKANGRLDGVKNQLSAKIDSMGSKLVSMMEEILGKHKGQTRTLLVYDHILKGHRERLDGHEKRLKAVEARRHAG